MNDRFDPDNDREMTANDVVALFGAMWSRAYDQQFLRLRRYYVVAQKLKGVKLSEFRERLQKYLRDPEAGAYANHSFLYFVSQYNNYARPKRDPYADD